MLLGDVIDQLLNENGFAHAGAAKQSDFSAFQEGLNQVDYFHAGFKHLRSGSLIFKRRGRPMDGKSFLGINGP